MESPIIEENVIQTKSAKPLSATPPRSPNSLSRSSNSSLTRRNPDVSASSGEYGLGRIQLSIRYSIQRQNLSVTIHKIMNIPLTDPSNIPDPYVKLYLLPNRSKESKRKTNVVKDNCNPVYETTFEYTISSAEIMQTDLEVTVCTQKGFLSYSGIPTIGSVS